MYSENHDQKHSATTTPPAPLGLPIQTQPGTPLGLPIQTQPGTPLGLPRTQEGPWSSGLFGCFDDLPNCCITCWCPCITFGQIAEIIDEGSTTCGTSGGLYALLAAVSACACFYSCIYRTKMRNKYMLNESPCADWLVHCCCEPCALCQEYRELRNQGFDMSKGWKENLEKKNSGMAMAPVVEGGMSR